MIKYNSYGRDNWINPAHVVHVSMSATTAWFKMTSGITLEMTADTANRILALMGAQK